MPTTRKPSETQFYQTLVSIETQLKKQNSFWRNSTMAIIKGLGNAIGATIIFEALLVLAKNKLSPYIKQIDNFIENKISIIVDEK